MEIQAAKRLAAFDRDAALTEDHIEVLISDDYERVQQVYREANRIDDYDQRDYYIDDKLRRIYATPSLLREYFDNPNISDVARRLEKNKSSDWDVRSYLRKKLDEFFL